MMTRAEHLAWAKARALEYLPHDPGSAVNSLASDLRKHPELGAILGSLGVLGLLAAQHGPEAVREWVERFE